MAHLGDFFLLSAFINPTWIVLGAIAVLISRKWIPVYIAVALTLAALSWWSSATQVAEQRSQFLMQQRLVEEQQESNRREKSLSEQQQKLDSKFSKLAVRLGMSPDSSHEAILERMDG